MSSDHGLRRAREDARNEAVLRARVLQGQEHENQIRQRTQDRVIGVLVQGPEGHHFHEVSPAEVSPRRVMDIPDLPGEDSSDFGGCIA